MTAKFWIGGTGTWDNTNDVNWSLSTGGANNTTHPTSADTATFDGSSGGGTVTVNATISISSLVYGAFTGTIDLATNNNNINIGQSTVAATGVSATGSGARTLNMGNGTWTIDATTNYWDATTVTSYTQAANSSTVVLTARSGASRTFNGNNKTFNNITVSAMSGTAGNNVVVTCSAGTITTLISNASCVLFIGANVSIGTFTINGSSAGALTLLRSSSTATQRTITLTNNFTPSWVAIQDISFSGGTNAASSSFDMGDNSGITITAPSAGGGPIGELKSFQRGTPY